MPRDSHIAQVAVNEFETSFDAGQIVESACGQVVDADHVMPLGEQTFDHVSTNKPGAAGDEKLHSTHIHLPR